MTIIKLVCSILLVRCIVSECKFQTILVLREVSLNLKITRFEIELSAVYDQIFLSKDLLYK